MLPTWEVGVQQLARLAQCSMAQAVQLGVDTVGVSREVATL